MGSLCGRFSKVNTVNFAQSKLNKMINCGNMIWYDVAGAQCGIGWYEEYNAARMIGLNQIKEI